MLSRFYLFLCVVMVSLFGCFESFEEALERTGKVFTCGNDQDCLPNYSCIMAGEGEGTCRPTEPKPPEPELCDEMGWLNDGICDTVCLLPDPDCDENNGGESSMGGESGTAGTDGDSGTAGTGGESGTAGTGGESGAAGTGGESGAAGTGGESGAAGTGGESGAAGTGGQSGAAGMGGESGAAGTGGESGAAGMSGEAGDAGMGGESGAAGMGGESGSGGTTQNGLNACIARCENMIFLAEACGGQSCQSSRTCNTACTTDATQYNELDHLETMVNRVRANLEANQDGACSSISTEAEGMIAAIEGICTGFNLCDSNTYDGQTSPVVKWANQSKLIAFRRTSSGTSQDNYTRIPGYDPSDLLTVLANESVKIRWQVTTPASLDLFANIAFEAQSNFSTGRQFSISYTLSVHRVTAFNQSTQIANYAGQTGLTAGQHNISFGLLNRDLGTTLQQGKEYIISAEFVNHHFDGGFTVKPSFSALLPDIGGQTCTANCYPEHYPERMCELILSDGLVTNNCQSVASPSDCFPNDYSQAEICIDDVSAGLPTLMTNVCQSRFKTIAHYTTSVGTSDSGFRCISPISCE